MKNLIFILSIPLFVNGCLYINHDVGLTTYEYDKCSEYFDENGDYHKDCPHPTAQKVVDGTYILVKEKYQAKNSKVTKTSCICSKSCVKRCLRDRQTRQECIKKCCHEKR